MLNLEEWIVLTLFHLDLLVPEAVFISVQKCASKMMASFAILCLVLATANPTQSTVDLSS